MSNYTYEHLYNKIDEEGIESLLRYGISAEQVPEDLQHDWARMQMAFDTFESLADQVMDKFPSQVTI